MMQKSLLLASLALCLLLIGSSSAPQWEAIDVELTAYCPCKKCCGPKAKGICSTGDKVDPYDGVAVDPKRIPYRTILDIPGVGLREADDTGGAMRNAENILIDVRMKTHEEALEFGRRKNVKVKIRKGVSHER